MRPWWSRRASSSSRGDPDQYPGNPNGMKDSWAVGRSGRWICRYHCVPRRRMYTPTAGSLVPYLSEEAFTGVRVTYLDQGGHELWDDFRRHPRPSLVHTWTGCTWFELKEGYGPPEWGDHHFTNEQRFCIWNEGNYNLDTVEPIPEIDMPHSGPGTPISTFICPCNGGAWQPWDCRIIPKYCHWLCEEAASLVTIVHHQLARGDVAGGPALKEPEFTMVGGQRLARSSRTSNQ